MAMDQEDKILHETANLYLYDMGKGKLELRLSGATHAISIGNPSHGVERAKKSMDRIEKNIAAIRKAYNHY